MKKGKFDEYILYQAAVENLLLRKQHAPVFQKIEYRLIDVMHTSKWHYSDCVNAIIKQRMKSN